LIASIGGSLAAVPVDGGSAVVVSRPDTAHGEFLQWGPRVANDRFIVYVSVGNGGISSNRLGVLDRRTGRTKVTTTVGTTVLGVVDDRVVWVNTAGTVMAAPLNKSGEIGTPQRLLEDVLVRPGGAAKAALSARGSLLYQRGVALSQLVLVDEHGTVTPLEVEPQAFNHPRWSPDGSRIAVTIARSGGSDIWSVDTRTKAASRLTTAEGSDDPPEWTADGKGVLYRSVSPAGMSLKRVAVDGSERPTVFLDTKLDPYEVSMSHNGQWAVMRTTDLTAKFRDIFAVPLAGDSTPRPFVATAGTETCPTLSTDDKWMAYASDESGRLEIYVRPFPGPGERVQISAAGGTEPRWSRDGQTLYYRVGRTLYAAKVVTIPTFAVTERRPLFEGTFITDAGHANYDPAPDGKHFLMLQSVDRQNETIMVYGWANELRRKWR
jgi:hypothetical protein